MLSGFMTPEEIKELILKDPTFKSLDELEINDFTVRSDPEKDALQQMQEAQALAWEEVKEPFRNSLARAINQLTVENQREAIPLLEHIRSARNKNTFAFDTAFRIAHKNARESDKLAIGLISCIENLSPNANILQLHYFSQESLIDLISNRLNSHLLNAEPASNPRSIIKFVLFQLKIDLTSMRDQFAANTIGTNLITLSARIGDVRLTAMAIARISNDIAKRNELMEAAVKTCNGAFTVEKLVKFSNMKMSLPLKLEQSYRLTRSVALFSLWGKQMLANKVSPSSLKRSVIFNSIYKHVAEPHLSAPNAEELLNSTIRYLGGSRTQAQ